MHHKILLVEDSESDFRLISRFLSRNPLNKISRARTIFDAVSALKVDAFDIILLDLGLPDSRGIVTLDKILPFCDMTPVVVLTGNEDSENGVLAVRRGAADYVVKGDITESILNRVILQSLERSRLRRLENGLIRTSLSKSGSDSPTSIDEMYSEHILNLIDAINSIRTYFYVKMNARDYEELEKIFNKYNVDVVSRELRDILSSHKNRPTRGKSIEIEMELLNEIEDVARGLGSENAKDFLNNVLSLDPDSNWSF